MKKLSIQQMRTLKKVFTALSLTCAVGTWATSEFNKKVEIDEAVRRYFDENGTEPEQVIVDAEPAEDLDDETEEAE